MAKKKLLSKNDVRWVMHFIASNMSQGEVEKKTGIPIGVIGSIVTGRTYKEESGLSATANGVDYIRTNYSLFGEPKKPLDYKPEVIEEVNTKPLEAPEEVETPDTVVMCADLICKRLDALKAEQIKLEGVLLSLEPFLS